MGQILWSDFCSSIIGKIGFITATEGRKGRIVGNGARGGTGGGGRRAA